MLSQKLVLKLFRKGLPKYGHLPKACSLDTGEKGEFSTTVILNRSTDKKSGTPDGSTKGVTSKPTVPASNSENFRLPTTMKPCAASLGNVLGV
ncbi:hypothetical protein RB195_003614 [Necator americanus]|uniref:Uncharacterized protein n=1 Tax=Necator americanus TaxID=51031 RepID=A0ABR1DPD3_NECAM